MAGNAQGGGSLTQNVGQMANQAQQTNAAGMGASSQYPGANLAAPGGSQLPNISPQTTNDIENLLQYYKQNAQNFAVGGEVSGYAKGGMPQAPVQGPQIAPQRPQIMPQAPIQGPQIAPQRPVDPRMAQNPGMTPNLGMMNRGMGQPVSAPMPGRNIAPQRPQIMGNPNATPVSKALRPQGRR